MKLSELFDNNIKSDKLNKETIIQRNVKLNKVSEIEIQPGQPIQNKLAYNENIERIFNVKQLKQVIIDYVANNILNIDKVKYEKIDVIDWGEKGDTFYSIFLTFDYININDNYYRISIRRMFETGKHYKNMIIILVDLNAEKIVEYHYEINETIYQFIRGVNNV